MRLLIDSAVFGIAFLFCATATAGDKNGGNSAARVDIGRLSLPDGSVLTIGTQSGWGPERTQMSVDAALSSRDNGALWRSFGITSVQHNAGCDSYYALARVTGDRILLFTTWNCRYCILDRKTGHVLERGRGDNVLGGDGAFVPLRLAIGLGLLSTMTRDYRNCPVPVDGESLKIKRLRGTFYHWGSIPDSRLENRYIIQMEDLPGGKSRRERQPLFVIVWKAEKSTVAFDYEKPTTGICVNGCSVTPKAGKVAVYALQPEHSLKEIPLAQEEISRLFAHITRLEARLDERAEFLGKHRYAATMGQALIEQCEFPADHYWEEKIGPHLKVVEPQIGGKSESGDMGTRKGVGSL